MILIDIDVPKWVSFFEPIIKELHKRGEKTLLISREANDYSELNEVLKLKKLDFISVGGYGTTLEEKLRVSLDRQTKLINIIKENNVNKIIGIGPDIIRVGFGLGIPVVSFNDMPTKDFTNDYTKVTPVSKLAIPFVTKQFKPFVIPNDIFTHLGLKDEQLISYNFIDPYLWIKDFKYDENYIKKIYNKYNISNKQKVIVREEEYKASYVDEKYPFVYNAIHKMNDIFDIEIIIIPRYESEYLIKEFPFAKVLTEKIELTHLLKDASLFIGGGGTINSEACFLGTPTISTRSFISHYDKWQIDKGMMVWCNTEDDIISFAQKVFNKDFIIDTSVLDEMNIDLNYIVDEVLNV
jgi:predicted glycosyltransferase